MKTILWVCVFVALGVCAVIDPPVPAPAAGGQVAPVALCTEQSSVWAMYDYTLPGSTVRFQFYRRSNCKHYFRIRSCTRYEVEYTTTHSWVGSPSYTINSISQGATNSPFLCNPTMLAILEANIVNAFTPGDSGWYHIFLTPTPAKLHWGGYVATWVSDPKKVWFS